MNSHEIEFGSIACSRRSEHRNSMKESSDNVAQLKTEFASEHTVFRGRQKLTVPRGKTWIKSYRPLLFNSVNE